MDKGRSPKPPPLGAIALGLVLGTLVLYAPVLQHGFVNFDDPEYVILNPHVRGGWSLEGLLWAFTSTSLSNWHPLTWLSHMTDCALFGLDAGRHHATSLLLHAASSVLLFLLLARQTAAVWRSAFVAALFAWHPLHVESVAWIAERKDVLSGTLGLAALLAYAAYAARPGWPGYARVAALFGLGLMAKPMLVTLPLVMLLLDHWPLKRVEPPLQLLREKLPLLALSAASAAVTYFVQARGGAVVGLEKIPLALRLPNAIVSCGSYLARAFWPAGLAVFYPYRAPSSGQIIACSLLLVIVSFAAIRAARRLPAVTVGWLWYLVMLLPVLGFVQAGPQRMADRYTYLPLIGVFVMAAWGAAALASPPAGRRWLVALAAWALIASAVATRLQLRYWSSSRALFERAVAVEPDDALARVNLGHALLEAGDTPRAAAQYVEAARLDPASVPARFNAGVTLLRLGHASEAVAQLKEAARLQPGALTCGRLGMALEATGALEAAAAAYLDALRLAPEDSFARERLEALKSAAR